MLDELMQSPAYVMACQQYDRVADILNLAQSERARTKLPKRAIMVAIPTRMDDGHTEMFTGYRVQHHLSVGPTKGGLRYHPDVTLGEVAALAMWMSWKCSLCGLPYGGAKGGVTCDPRRMSRGELERMTRRFTQEMIPFIGPHVDVMAPDLGTNEQIMAWMMDTYSMHEGNPVPQIVTGKPLALGGSAGRKEATGRGVAYLVNRALDNLGLRSEGLRVAVQGFGNVGSVAAQQLHRFGARIVGISDYTGGVFSSKGLDVNQLIDYAAKQGGLEGFHEGCDRITNEELLQLECEVLVPAALERQITGANVGKIRCRVLAEAANGPTTIEADAVLRQRDDILVIPDVLCNAGGVIVSYFEWVQDLQSFFWGEAEVNDKLYRQLELAYQQVVQMARKNKLYMRDAALALGIAKVAQAKQVRGLFP
ncbi:MAG TPA: Glu/Leu/Phe/Val dehydrogenase [Verrucomicrobiae bacterium]|nr:Glu/Leu/Phe/Val dehydrogenase [Verrucomicrobiae bacterium]